MVGDASPNRLDAKVWAITELLGSTNIVWDTELGKVEGYQNKWS
jgi:phage terminase large subunit-like protein